MARGRKRKAGPRFPNGQPKRSRPEEAKENKSVGIQARIRVHKLKPAEAEREEAGHVLGRMLIEGHLGPALAEDGGPGIGQLRFNAGEEYENICRFYARAMGTRGVRSGSDYNGPAGYDGSEGDDPAYVARCNRDERAYAESIAALRAADPFAEKMLNLLQRGIFVELGGVMLPPILKGLDALAVLYRVDGWVTKPSKRKAA
jgi:hypothetical protein